ncbi:MAG TPA: protein translocase subunit SecD [Ktedonobacteraceae bacterium]
MRRGTILLLLLIILLAAAAGYAVWPNNPGLHVLGLNNDLAFHQGLDLQGGTSVQLEPIDYGNISAQQLSDSVTTAEGQIALRVGGGLGVNDATIRLQTVNGKPGILVELPGLNSGDQQAAIDSLTHSGKLEFWPTGTNAVPVSSNFDPSQYVTYNNNSTKPPFTGADLDPNQVAVSADEAGRPQINFAMKSGSSAKFCTFTQNNIGQYMSITLDRSVIQSATIQSAICGQGQITGQFTQAEAQSIVNLLKFGALPVSFKVASQQTVGATLGADSVQKSLLAAIIGLGIVVFFMLVYYRLPGLLADFALLIYSAVSLAIFKLGGITLSLAGIAGFILSVGMAVDANVLIFERVKEELRAGRLLSSAIDIGWKRAWPSIRDSNISTMLTCAVLYYFGGQFGATLLQGFATTLFLGVAVSMFTAVVVTRTFLNLLVPTGIINHPWWFGLPRGAIASSSASRSRRNSTAVEGNAVRGESRV